jgi:hypothetical protein
VYEGKENLKRVAIIAVVLALLFNSVGSLFAAASMLNQAQSFANQDAMLICTGKTFKWISLQAFDENGKVEYIEPPDSAPDSPQHLKCSYTYLAESSSDDEFVSFDMPTFRQNHTQLLPQHEELLVPSSKHLFAVTRAPPSIS